jgi:hypothetical protein
MGPLIFTPQQAERIRAELMGSAKQHEVARIYTAPAPQARRHGSRFYRPCWLRPLAFAPVAWQSANFAAPGIKRR